MRRRLVWADLKSLAVVALLALLCLTTAGPPARPLSDDELATFVRETARAWRARHGAAADLQVALIEVRFSGRPADFTEGEGVVVAPVGVELPGAQQVLEIATRPERLRRIDVEGVATVVWEYPGSVHRELHYAALVLVRRAPAGAAAIGASPTFASLNADIRDEAMVRVKDSEEHSIQRCAEFAGWARLKAGPAPHTDQLLRLARAAQAQLEHTESACGCGEDVCAATREGKLSPHLAQVLTTMAAREVEIPAFAFASATPARTRLVGTYVDSLGWVLVDVEHAERGLMSGGDVLLTKAPLIGAFAASSHGMWYPDATAYAAGGWSGWTQIADTTWGKGPRETTARTLSLEDACR